MINHEKIRTIQTDIYNNFYLKIKDMESTEDSWVKIIERGKYFTGKYRNDRIAEILIIAYEDIIEQEWNQK